MRPCAAVASVTLVNVVLKLIIQKISVFERPASFISLQRNIAAKVFIAQFFNTAVSLLVVNAAIPELLKGRTRLALTYLTLPPPFQLPNLRAPYTGITTSVVVAAAT